MTSTFDGIKLENYRYPVLNGRRKGIVFFVHGYGCSLHNHAFLAQMFAANGYEFCGIDQSGFGLSEGVKGRIESVDMHKQDIEKFNELYLSKFGDADVPKFLMGHSLGGMISSFIVASSS